MHPPLQQGDTFIQDRGICWSSQVFKDISILSTQFLWFDESLNGFLKWEEVEKLADEKSNQAALLKWLIGRKEKSNKSAQIE